MNAEQQNEVWAVLDRGHRADVARRGPSRSLRRSAARTSTVLLRQTATSTSEAHSC